MGPSERVSVCFFAALGSATKAPHNNLVHRLGGHGRDNAAGVSGDTCAATMPLFLRSRLERISFFPVEIAYQRWVQIMLRVSLAKYIRSLASALAAFVIIA